jgi:hypothetical protein
MVIQIIADLPGGHLGAPLSSLLFRQEVATFTARIRPLKGRQDRGAVGRGVRGLFVGSIRPDFPLRLIPVLSCSNVLAP